MASVTINEREARYEREYDQLVVHLDWQPFILFGRHLVVLGILFASVRVFFFTCVQEGRLSGGWFPDTGDDDVFHPGAFFVDE